VTGRSLRDQRARLEDVVAGSELVFPVRRLAPDGLQAWAEVLEGGYEGHVAKAAITPVRAGADEALALLEIGTLIAATNVAWWVTGDPQRQISDRRAGRHVRLLALERHRAGDAGARRRCRGAPATAGPTSRSMMYGHDEARSAGHGDVWPDGVADAR
jgi:hypothetical protein